jgi:hypothetical protein
MDFGELIPVVAILSGAWVAVTMARLRHDKSGGDCGASSPDLGDVRDNARLAHENERLRLTIDRLEDRLAVLERIATDPAERTAREIEQLR